MEGANEEVFRRRSCVEDVAERQETIPFWRDELGSTARLLPLRPPFELSPCSLLKLLHRRLLGFQRRAMSAAPSPPAASSSSLAAPSLPAPDTPIASTSTAAPPASTDAPTVVLSKNAAKRLARQAALDAAKPARRLKERQQKKEKAAEKRKLIELGVLEKPVNKKANLGPKQPYKARVVIDCAFDDKMTEKVRLASSLARTEGRWELTSCWTG
jgi:hypothetical protein